MATLRCNTGIKIDPRIEDTILEYLESLPVGAICCSSELKELVFGEVPKKRMMKFEMACKEMMLSNGFVPIDRPYTNEYGQQRCFQKLESGDATL